MLSDQPAVRATALGKRYEIYASPQDRLKQMIYPRVSGFLNRKPRQYFREFWALRDVDFSIERGETVGIIGQNGSGKSTLLQLLCGTLHPTLGSAVCSGRIAALLELGAGFNPEFTGSENVYLSGMLYGLSESELGERYASIVAFADIGDFIAQPVKTYSSGMYVRLAFAIVAHVNADVLVIDEALSVGDVRFTQKCMRFLREFKKSGTLLFVSHDPGAVTNLCSRALWLHKGRLQLDGVAGEVVEAYLAEQHALDRAATGEAVSVAATVRARPAAPPAAAVPVSDTGSQGLREGALKSSFGMLAPDSNPTERSFGAGGALIESALLGRVGRAEAVQLLEGGEAVVLSIHARIIRPQTDLIFGFHVKDRLGQQLFGDNSHFAYLNAPIAGDTGERFVAEFHFVMPLLRAGVYAVDVAVASGTQDDHTQQHWIRDAIEFRIVDTSIRHGLVGIQMTSIRVMRAGETVS